MNANIDVHNNILVEKVRFVSDFLREISDFRVKYGKIVREISREICDFCAWKTTMPNVCVKV